MQGLLTHPLLLLLTLLYIVTISITTLIGAILSKEVSPIARTMANISRIMIIWVVNLSITVHFKGDPQYQLESLNVYVNIAKFVGFVLLVTGMGVYVVKRPVEDQGQEGYI